MSINRRELIQGISAVAVSAVVPEKGLAEGYGSVCIAEYGAIADARLLTVGDWAVIAAMDIMSDATTIRYDISDLRRN